jgi:DeoR/GlpR family transcriptional regulator of sugar metabolism
MKRVLARRSAHTYVLASREKVGAASPYAVLPLSAVTGVVTDAPGDDPAVRELRAAGVPLLEA